MTEFLCRIAVKSGSDWTHKVLTVSSFKMNSKNSAKVFHPLMLRSLSTVISLTVGGQANVWPTVIADFGQWNETMSIKGYIPGTGDDEGAKFVDATRKYSYLRRWIMRNQADSTNYMYAQMYMTDIDDDTDPEVAFDPTSTPFGTTPGFGYPGMITSLDMDDYKAGDGDIKYTISFQVGRVIPL